MSRISMLAAAAVLLLAATALGAPPPTWGFGSAAEAKKAAQALQSMSATDKTALFRAWKKEAGKTYADNGAEDKSRFTVWSANLAEMIKWNQQPNPGYFKGLNEFSDMSFEEFAGQRLMKNLTLGEIATRSAAAPQLAAPRSARKLQQTTVPNEWDWRTQGKVPAVRNQGGCGSCWAFAAVGALEIKAQIDSVSTAPNQAEQQMVDCVNSRAGYWSAGCNGGYSDEVFRYTNTLFATTEAAYPYTATTSTCKVTTSTVPPTGALTVAPSPGYYTVAANPDAIMQAVATKGPVVTYFNVQSSFYSYSSGIYQASSCTTETINHAMIIVGFNKTAGVGSPDSYWIIRNSWGTWGDQGYIKVQMTNDNVGSCRMYSGLMVPLTTSNAVPKPTPSPAPKPCKGRKC